MNNAGYMLRQGIRNIAQHAFMAFASITTLASCLVIIGSFFFASMCLSATISKLEQSSDIRFFVDEALTDDEVTAIGKQIIQINGVLRTEYISRERGLEEFRETLGDDAALLDGFEEDNPLRDGYRVWIAGIESYEAVDLQIREMPGIASVHSNINVATTLINIKNVINTVCYAFIALLGAVSALIIANTVRITMTDRREEIAILKMIGARNSFIRLPFMIEGCILGLVGGALAMGALTLLIDALEGFLSGINFAVIISFGDLAPAYTGVFLFAGLATGFIGSIFMIRKFLRV